MLSDDEDAAVLWALLRSSLVADDGLLVLSLAFDCDTLGAKS
jgi:hypothetical protein